MEPTQHEENGRPAGYRRPERSRRRKKTLGAAALTCALLALALVLAFCVYAFFSYRSGTLGGGDVRLGLIGVWAVAALALAGAGMGAAALFLKRQKKGMAIAALATGLVVLALCCVGLYAYQYVFDKMKQDEQFAALPDEALKVVQIKPDGEIVRETEPLATTLPIEQIEESPYYKEIEWEPIDYQALPEEAQALLDAEPPKEPSYLRKGAEQVSNILLFGLDVSGASDSIILLSVDRAHQKIKMISLARDSYLWIPEFGTYAKLAYPYHWGGAQMAVGTVNYNFLLDVTDYIAVDFDQLAELIDMVGGVEVELDWDEIRCLQRLQSGLTYGTNRLYGEAAVYYSRLRESSASDNEIKRTGRQREVLTSLLQSAKQTRVGDFPRLIRNCLGMCTTSLDAPELLDIALEVVQGNYTIESYSLIESVGYWGGVFGDAQYFYCVYDINRASDWIYRTIYEDLYISSYPD